MSLKLPRRLLTGFSLLAVVLAGGFLVEESLQIYKRELSMLQKNLSAQATLLAEHTQLAFSAADRMLMEVSWKGDHDSTQEFLAGHSLYQSILLTPQLAALAVFDAEGRTVFTAKKFATPMDALTVRGFLEAHHERTFALGGPILVGREARRLIPVSKRLTGANGQLAGVAVVLLDAAYFQRFYTAASNDANLRIGMFHRDGTALSLYPAPPARAASSQQGLAALFARHEARSLMHVSPLDDSKRISAYRNLPFSPVVVTVSYSYQAFLAGLAPTLLRKGIIFLLFTAGTLFSALLLNRAMRDAYRAREAQLGFQRQQQQTLQLCHAIAHNLPNGRVFVLDHALRYEFVEGQAWQDDPVLKPGAVIGRTVREVYPAETSRIVESLAKRALAGKEADQEISFKGRVYKAFVTPLPDDDGQIQRCLLLAQDITQLKADQEALEQLNQELHRLASCDGLLKVANRREFERVLDLEWRRQGRERQPLSLLMIDVDYFKRYNDAYGHTEGDACLQQIAAILRETVKRPSDLVARYGGEEMAILLPSTDLPGALHVAQRVHALLAERAIPFDESPVAAHVTVSIGAASMLPTPDLAPLALVEKADDALYAAKERGRNRTDAQQSMYHGVAAPGFSSA